MLETLIDQLNPECSDDEDNTDELTQFTLEVQKDSGCTVTPLDCKAVIVCAAGPASAYLRALLPSLKPAPWLLKVVKEPERRFPPPPKPASFLVSGNVAVACLEKEIASDLTFAWSSALLAGFPEASQVIFMDTICRADWRVTNEQERPQEPHLAGLWSNAYGSEAPCPSIKVLSSPNFLGGLPAALLSQCEAGNKRCLAALALQDGAHVMASTLVGFEALRPLFVGIGIECEKSPDLVKAVETLVSSPSLAIYA